MSDNRKDPKLSEKSTFPAADDHFDLQKEERIKLLRKKLAKQQETLISAAEESYLKKGNLLQERVAEEADKYFQLMESLDENMDEDVDVE